MVSLPAVKTRNPIADIEYCRHSPNGDWETIRTELINLMEKSVRGGSACNGHFFPEESQEKPTLVIGSPGPKTWEVM